MKITPAIRSLLAEKFQLPTDASDEKARELLFAKLASGALTAKDVAAAEKSHNSKHAGSTDEPHNPRKDQSTMDNPTSTKAFGGDNINVKAPSEIYSDVRYPAKHHKTGRDVYDGNGNPVMLPSDRMKARYGALTQLLYKRCGGQVELKERTLGIIDEMLNADPARNPKDAWVGDIGDNYEKDVHPKRVKDLLSSSPSGGIALNPIWLDEQLVQYVYLNGELFPYVTQVQMPRGSTAHGAALGEVTVLDGATDGTATSLFDTSNFVSALDTDVHRMAVAIAVSRTLIADAMIENLGSYLFENAGGAMKKRLDYYIANGDGVTMPQGIFQAPGVTAIPSCLGPNGQITLGDIEALAFGLPKEYRDADMGSAFVGADATYRRIRSLPIGSDDARRLAGNDEFSYKLLGNLPYRVQQDVPQSSLAFGALKRYRMYVRQGQEMEFSTQGQSLMLANEALLMISTRVGGRVVDPRAFCVMDDLSVTG